MTERTELGRNGNALHMSEQLEAALATADEEFHQAYSEARSQAKHESPVFVLLADTLVVFHRDVRTELRYTPDAFSLLKQVSHVPVAIYAELQRVDPNDLPSPTRERLEKLQKLALTSHAKLQGDTPQLALTESTSRDVRTALSSSITLLELALGGGATSRAVETFANALGPVLMRLIHEATRLQLESLHACVEDALAPMTAAERAGLHVVVTGDHQARARSLGMQYFRMRLREPDNVEERVAYAEGVSDEKEAFDLVGTRRLDRAVAGAFFGDRKRMQRDLLGDSAAALLRDRPFDAID